MLIGHKVSAEAAAKQASAAAAEAEAAAARKKEQVWHWLTEQICSKQHGCSTALGHRHRLHQQMRAVYFIDTVGHLMLHMNGY